MLMDLRRMREWGWERKLLPLYEEFKSSVVFGDQDLVNIYFSYHPHQLHLLPCEYNYRPDYCMYGDKLCLATQGIRIIHGNRGFFHREETEPVFSQLYSALRKVSRIFAEILIADLILNISQVLIDGSPICSDFLLEAESEIRSRNTSSCNLLHEKFLRFPRKILQPCEDWHVRMASKHETRGLMMEKQKCWQMTSLSRTIAVSGGVC